MTRIILMRAAQAPPQDSATLYFRAALTLAVVGILLLLVIAGLLYKGYRRKQQGNELLLAQQKDITRKNASLQNLVNEKEWLLREVHHRVRNNLQIVISLLKIQSAYLEDEAARNAVRQSQDRMNALSLIHQRVYQSQITSLIPLRDYTEELVRYLQSVFDTGERIIFHIDMGDISLDLSQALPIGLILNEAITNAIRHSFTGQREGRITISVVETAPDQLLLCIRDNGSGMAPELLQREHAAVGIRLMELLSEQLEARLQFYNDAGLVVCIDFRKEAE